MCLLIQLQVKSSSSSSEERYFGYNFGQSKVSKNTSSLAASNVDEYFLVSDKKVDEVEAQSYELDSLTSTPASQKKSDFVVSYEVKVEVPGLFFSNPLAVEKDATFDVSWSDTNGQIENDNKNNNNTSNESVW